MRFIEKRLVVLRDRSGVTITKSRICHEHITCWTRPFDATELFLFVHLSFGFYSVFSFTDQHGQAIKRCVCVCVWGEECFKGLANFPFVQCHQCPETFKTIQQKTMPGSPNSVADATVAQSSLCYTLKL